MIRPTRSEPRHTRARVPFASDDRGASSIELVMYTPILMLITFLVVQFALTWYGQEVAGVVAREAARVARVDGGTPEALAAAEARGKEYATTVGGDGFTELQVTVVLIDPNTVLATVTGRSVEIIPGFAPRVSAHVQGPVETFRPDA